MSIRSRSVLRRLWMRSGRKFHFSNYSHPEATVSFVRNWKLNSSPRILDLHYSRIQVWLTVQLSCLRTLSKAQFVRQMWAKQRNSCPTKIKIWNSLEMKMKKKSKRIKKWEMRRLITMLKVKLKSKKILTWAKLVNKEKTKWKRWRMN